MIAMSGSAKRPSSPRKPGPPPGTVVQWRLCTPIADLAAQAEELGWVCGGIIGNTAHLQGNGDHTPWSAGKKRGVIYAGDWHTPDPFERWYAATARTDYDTTWIDFININGRQYNNAGQVVASSGDFHLHVSVAAGYEDRHVSLFADFAGGGDDIVDAKTIEAIADAVWSHTISTQSFEKGAGHGAHEGVVNAIVAARDARAAKEAIAALTKRLDTAGAGGATVTDEQLDVIAARVVERLGALRFDVGAT